MSSFVGIDVSKAKLDVVILHDDQAPHFQVPNTPAGWNEIHRRLQERLPITQIGLEATGRYGEGCARFLIACGYALSYLNPKLIHDFAKLYPQRSKTDRDDAWLIAHYCRLHRPDCWQPQDEAQMRLQQLSRRLHSLETMRQQERNRYQSGLNDPAVLQSMERVIACFEQEMQQVNQAIQQLIQQQPRLQQDCRLLVSIKGIGEKTAHLLLAELGDIRRFDSPKQLVAFVGVAPQHFQSGSSVNKRSKISKRGNVRVRTALYMPAVVAKQWNPACRALSQRLKERQKPGKVIVIAVLRKLLHQIFGVLKSGCPFDPKLGFPA